MLIEPIVLHILIVFHIFFQDSTFSNDQSSSSTTTNLGRGRVVSQSFKEKSPVRPREPPPPPPPNKAMYDLPENDESAGE